MALALHGLLRMYIPLGGALVHQDPPHRASTPWTGRTQMRSPTLALVIALTLAAALVITLTLRRVQCSQLSLWDHHHTLGITLGIALGMG